MHTDLGHSRHAPGEPATSPDHGAPGPAGPPITLLLVEGLDLLRSALVSLLSGQEDLEVVAAVKDTSSAVPVALRLRPEVIVINVDRPDNAGLTTVQQLRQRLPNTQIVALTAGTQRGLVQRLLAADVRGVVNQNTPAARLLEAIRGTAQGELTVDLTLAVAALAIAPNPLTPRELEVLKLAADGLSGPEIATHLHLSPGTVRNYLSKIITKTSARNRIDAVRIARNAGWI